MIGLRWLPMACVCLFISAAAHGQEGGEDYRVARGDTLAAIALKIYGDSHYAAVIAQFNRLPDPRGLKAGQIVSVPPLRVILEREKLTPFLDDAFIPLLRAREAFISNEAALRQRIRASDGPNVPLDRDELRAASADIAKAIAALQAPREGIKKKPASLIGQLNTARGILSDLAGGRQDEYGYDLDDVHRRLANALSYAIVWARSGYE